MILILASKIDVAGMTIVKQLRTICNFEEMDKTFDGNAVHRTIIGGKKVELAFTTRDIIYSSHISESFSPELVICASRHSSESRLPVLTVHVPGNFHKAESGGEDKKVSIAPVYEMKSALRELLSAKEDLGLDEYRVSYEATHHGPSLDIPVMYIEIGSTIERWQHKEAGLAAAKAIISSIDSPQKGLRSIGVGGGHYAPKFTKLGLDTEAAFGHIVPKYATAHITEEMLRQLVERTTDRAEMLVLDWKGVRGKERTRIIEMAEDVEVDVRKARDMM
ncbi:MAG: D-aminoacyl-tRNA deacylase [Candidatus Hodarchaeota archaeon]